MIERNDYVQNKWRNGMLPGINCIVFANADVIVANAYRVKDDNAGSSKQYWFPFCDTTIASLEKYEADIWTKIDIADGAIDYGDQKIVFGEGSMGNEGFVAATNINGDLIWGIFFTFSNPIFSAKIIDDVLICVSETELEIKIDLHDLTKILIEPNSDF